MSVKDFGLKEGDAGDNKKFEGYVDSDGKNIHKAKLMKKKKGWFGKERFYFHVDLTIPLRKVEAEIAEAELKLKQLEDKWKTTHQETINMINSFEPSIYSDHSIYSRLKSKLKDKKKDEAKVREVTIAQVQPKYKDNQQQQSKGKNQNGQHNNQR